jgi:Secretion system C-terminal sorting domain
MKKLFTIILAALIVSSSSAQTTIASWLFETLPNPTVGSTTVSTGGTLSIPLTSAIADAGVLTSGTVLSAVHASSSTVYSTPGGNGTTKALSSNFWAVGDYYQFKVSTVGYSGIKASWDHTGSSTGPSTFKVQYSTTAGGASGYSDLNTYTIPNNPLSTPTAGAAYTWSAALALSPAVTSFSADLSAIAASNDKPELYIRLTCNALTPIGTTSSFGTGGTSRIDNFKVTYDVVIPVEMTSFTAKKVGSANKLAWQTATEINNYYFDVERSNDGATFQNIGKVKGVGNTNTLSNYDFMDENPLAGTNYYRLQQVDVNGKTTTSKTVAVNANGKGSVKVFPTLATDKLSVLTTSEKEEAYEIVNLVGQIVAQGRLTNSAEVQISQLAKGNYVLKIAGETVKFTKQ